MKNLGMGWLLVLGILASNVGNAAETKPQAGPRLNISYDPYTEQVTVSWSGKGVLKQALDANGKFKPVRGQNKNSYTASAADKKAVYRLDSSLTSDALYSQNIVGYVNLTFPPGLTLANNPLYQPTNSVAALWPVVPDGSQILKYVPNSGYEVATFDGLSGQWSNPDLQFQMAQGFYFRNPSSQTFVNTFVGEVPTGQLVVPLPAGYSMKGSLVPQEGSINTVHGIPGRPGEQIRTYTNNGQGGGTDNISVYDGQLKRWDPDLNLKLGEAFWVYKHAPQDWVRIFNPF